ncbi:heat shock 70 kDa protein 12A-like [Acanthochromis polyacanthus]|uniref:heat shock 70 kDa protein 12A-like n=1 Tax=Acanthochromis polyacanthus TaxID=80966 RepID=UPI002233E88B|nr:heat shock 70 kDa protein 12A-like [Acanthochromis polyacanthus]
MGDSFVIAIDFGTTFSGYAYSMTPREEEADPYIKYWGEEVGKETPKTPTCILFNEQEEFLKFGYEAKRAYDRMRGEEARKKLFFNCFKMSLYGKKVTSDLTIKAANGKSVKALKVFTEALRYLKDDALKTISDHAADRRFIASDFTWVLTVPAIWDPAAKQFMREAATQAGIVTKGKEDKLVIALEPEAASVFCKTLPAEGFIAENQGEDKLDQSPGTQYIVVDCGGGTIDITVHAVLNGGKLKELHKVSGNDMGGQTVDRKFKEFLREIFCDGVWDEYERKYPSDVQKMMYDFTVFKRHDDDVEIGCPYTLGRVAQEVKDVEKFFEQVQGASWNDGSINISRVKLRSFFDESLKSITTSLTEILKANSNIEYILLVGGYAESQILRKHIKDQFGRHCKVLCPTRPQEVIMKGAVMFGRNPEVLASRKSAFTYGIEMRDRFDASKHKEGKKLTHSGSDWCKDIFNKLVEIGEDVGWDEPREYTFGPAEEKQSAMTIAFYCTEEKNPAYVDDDGVSKIGSFVVNMPNTEGGMNRQVKLEVKFGFTEMKAMATDLDSGSTESVELNFITKS